jgi:acyl-CoA reductase-like NAD-dependent aldehyde dehydrogenase
MGPIVTSIAHQRITGYIEQGAKEGAKLLVDGRTFDAKNTGPGCEKGFWMGGTLFDHVTPDMRIYKEEIFGPVLGCVRVKDFAEAVNWYRKAAIQGDSFARHSLGVMYALGQGVVQNRVAAYALFNTAAVTNDKARKSRELIIKLMTPAQIEAGQALTQRIQAVGQDRALD